MQGCKSMMHGCEKALQSCKGFVQGCEKALQGCKSFKHWRNGFARLQKALRHTHKKDKESSGQVAAMWKQSEGVRRCILCLGRGKVA